VNLLTSVKTLGYLRMGASRKWREIACVDFRIDLFERFFVLASRRKIFFAALNTRPH